MKEQLVYFGVDIAKSYLDAAMGNEKRRFSNERIGHRELIKWVKQLKAPVQVICESSGGYERALVQALVGAQLKVSLVQANRVRQFARAAGILAKTDRIDAEVLCAFGEVMQPGTIGASQLEQEHLRELESQRRHLTHLLVMEQNRAARVSDGYVRRLNRSLLNQIKKQIEQLDLLIKEHIEASPELSVKAKKLTAISGVGARTAALLLAQMPELGRSTAVKLRRLSESHHLIVTVGKCAVNVPSMAGAGPCGTACTWPHWSPPGTIPSCTPFICDCVLPVNQPSLLSLPTMRKLLIVLNSALKPDLNYA